MKPSPGTDNPNAPSCPPFPSFAPFFPTSLRLSLMSSKETSPVAPSRPMYMMASRAFRGTLIERVSGCQSNVPRHVAKTASWISARCSS